MASGGPNGDLMSFEDDQNRKPENTGSLEDSKIETGNGASTEGISGQADNPEPTVKIVVEKSQTGTPGDRVVAAVSPQKNKKKGGNKKSNEFAQLEQHLLEFLEKDKLTDARELVKKMKTYSGIPDKKGENNALMLSIKKGQPDIALRLIKNGRQSIQNKNYWTTETKWACQWLLERKDRQVNSNQYFYLCYNDCCI